MTIPKLMKEHYIEQGFVEASNGFFYNERLDGAVGLGYKNFIYKNVIAYKSIVDENKRDGDTSYYRVLRTILRDVTKAEAEFNKGRENKCISPIKNEILQNMSTKELNKVIRFWASIENIKRMVYTNWTTSKNIPGLGEVENVNYTLGQYVDSIQITIPFLKGVLWQKRRYEMNKEDGDEQDDGGQNDNIDIKGV